MKIFIECDNVESIKSVTADGELDGAYAYAEDNIASVDTKVDADWISEMEEKYKKSIEG